MDIENIKKKKITGFTIRTTNEKEMNPFTGQIPNLWKRFNDGVQVDYKNGNHVYGVYFKYGSGAGVLGAFTVLAGTDQADIVSSEPLETIVIKSGKYLVFQATGEMPQIVTDTWGKIWEYFSQENAPYKRLYKTDFEYYVNQEEIKIYIAVE